jgi:hypothetical protein
MLRAESWAPVSAMQGAVAAQPPRAMLKVPMDCPLIQIWAWSSTDMQRVAAVGVQEEAAWMRPATRQKASNQAATLSLGKLSTMKVFDEVLTLPAKAVVFRHSVLLTGTFKNTVIKERGLASNCSFVTLFCHQIR